MRLDKQSYRVVNRGNKFIVGLMEWELSTHSLTYVLVPPASCLCM